MKLPSNLQTLTISLSLLLLTFTSTLMAEESVAAEVADLSIVELTVSNITSDGGNLYITVYDSKKTWLKEAMHSTEVLVADHLADGVITTTLELPDGEYAISVHHDANDNQEMERTFIGLPKEPVGLSNNQVPRFGPPKFKKSKFVLTGLHQENIKLQD